jgi:hypothetical protein
MKELSVGTVRREVSFEEGVVKRVMVERLVLLHNLLLVLLSHRFNLRFTIFLH